MPSDAEMLARLKALASVDGAKGSAIRWAVKRIGELEGALEPFAQWADRLTGLPNWMPDGCPLTLDPTTTGAIVTVGTLRAARAALSPAPAQEAPVVACSDCGAPYGSDGWCDVVVPDEIWNRIAPEGGILCFRCMTKRIQAQGLDQVPVMVASGPYADANGTWRAIGWEQGRKVGSMEAKIPAAPAKEGDAQP